MQQIPYKKKFSVWIALALGLIAGMLSFFQVFHETDQHFSTTLYGHSPLKNETQQITLIDIDEESIAEYGDSDSWSGELLAEAISQLSSEGADIIGIDTALWQSVENGDGQEAFEEACDAAGNVVSISSFSKKFENSDAGEESDSTPDTETEKLTNPGKQTGPGNQDEPGNQTNPENQNAPGKQTDSGKQTEPGNQSNPAMGSDDLNAKADDNVTTISFADLLAGNYNSSDLSDHVVFIGVYNSFYGNWVDMMFHPDTVEDLNSILQAILCALLAIGFYLLASREKFARALCTCIALVVCTYTGAFILQQANICFYLLIPTGSFLLGFILSLVERVMTSVHDKKKMEQTLKLYVDSQVVDEISEKTPRELALVSERKDIAVLFIDIRGFTAMSESLEPEQVVEILNEYLSLVARSIQKYDGTLDKFIGDAAMAVFNAPKNLDDYLFRAVCTADEIVRCFSHIREKYEKRYGKTVSFGIGINCGEAIVGNVGSESRMDYTAIGDTVNVAARLEANAAAGQILISETAAKRLKGRIQCTCIGPLKLKGKAKEVTVYQVDKILQSDS